jgi:hypothetical protein
VVTVDDTELLTVEVAVLEVAGVVPVLVMVVEAVV